MGWEPKALSRDFDTTSAPTGLLKSMGAMLWAEEEVVDPGLGTGFKLPAHALACMHSYHVTGARGWAYGEQQASVRLPPRS